MADQDDDMFRELHEAIARAEREARDIKAVEDGRRFHEHTKRYK